MGKTKTAIIDDSVQEEPKKEKPKKVLGSINKTEEEAPKRTKILNNKAEEGETPKKEATPKKETVKEEKKAPEVEAKPRHSVKYREAAEKVERNKLYPIVEAVELAKATSYSKFEGSLEIHINTNVKTLRGLVSLPFASGKQVKILAFGKGAEESGADLIGTDEKIKELEKGKIDFDAIVTTAEWMPRLARLAKVLGPRGLMPNPKSGTITTDLKKAVAELQSGKVEYKTEKVGGVMHLGIGKLNQPTEELSQNIKVLLTTIGKSKLKLTTIAPTMGPGIKVDTSGI